MATGYRQGDVYIEPVEALPIGCAAMAPSERAGDSVHVLAEGEATGHAHWIGAGEGVAMLRPDPAVFDPLTVGYLALRSLARVVHDEHAPIDLPAGNYRVVQQRRFAPLGQWRRAPD
ncbi:MAG: hypothetical protein AB7I59_19715 [Geminicoccaceae bacterium]